ncbi:MAB_1171c family putative transporter [Amycolatopsis anabasis]|uniref:MAB_1171c family putative transporter n=1 Tax=Amycolatopsis anabasis TaxID=1840409 RepID=UPI00131AACDD|nr:MAB_1171c family putative transporter [Amycolatopsis anabasis]
MNPLLVAYGVAAFAALGWMGFRLARTPRNLPLRAVTGLIACWAIAFPFGVVADKGKVVFGLPPMMSRLLQHGLLLVGVNCLVCFFLFSALDAHRARIRAWWFALPLVVAEIVLAVAAVLTPDGVRTNDHSVPSVAVFFITADLYMAFGFAAAFVWTRRYARGAEARLARGLRIASIGLAAIVLADCVFVPLIVLRWIGGAATPALAKPGGAAGTNIGALASMFLLLPGIVVFLIGISYPAAVMRIAAVRVWWQHLRAYHHLGPLWTALHERFPEDALSRVPVAPWRDLLSLRGVHRRYYRRVIECRDGLVRISPYFAQPPEDDATTADRLRHALRAHAAGEPVSAHAVPVAIPTGEGLDADVHELVALSLALKGNP